MAEPSTSQATAQWWSVIPEAARVLVERSGCEPDEAFEELSAQARVQGLTMATLSTAIVAQHNSHGGTDHRSAA